MRNSEWVKTLERKLSSMNIDEGEIQEMLGWEIADQGPTIFKVSEILRDVQPNAYEPTIVSLGPYHHDKPQLKAMNKFKWFLLKTWGDSGRCLRDSARVIEENETEARNAYSVQPINMVGNQFAELMLLDCVFVIMILWFWKKKKSGFQLMENKIFKRSWMIVARDMLLLENQLPFFLLETLFHIKFPYRQGKLKKWMVRFFSGFVSNNISLVSVSHDARIHHILHLFYLCIKPPEASGDIVPQPNNIDDLRSLSSVTRLEETGIKFRRKQRATCLLGITFKKGVLEIPQFEVDDNTNILFRNLIAFEQCYNRNSAIVDGSFAAYASYMSCMISTAADVEILQQNKIIIRGIGNNKQVADFFNKLCKEVVVNHGKCYVSQIFKEVNKYSRAERNRWWADLNRRYFHSPWSVISVIAAISLFAITFTQLIFTMLNYFHAHKRRC
ncbi:UPF0481 protein At3g47200-like [Zingiber officinale]|uniref:UPF0481 protein At3g47200-like n=1 Tax=Zingiber officinale TaxID=94328 RepID=UPI001C4C0D8E|nr:UPF0481 protein At3g47200-like [Zingiber officinale]